MEVPEIMYNDQVQATIRLDPRHSFTKRFSLTTDQSKVVLSESIRSKWYAGEDCPVDGTYNMVFLLESQLAGRSERYGSVTV